MPLRSRAVDGPFVATAGDIEAINRVFSAAFTERYHRDGMTGVRVPALNPAVWRYAIADAAEGAHLWRDGQGAIAAFNMVHRSGYEGWMGPLAVRPDLQSHGVGRRIVSAGIEYLERAGALVIGLETMPRTIDNIGFYSGLGFRPGHLTVTMVRGLNGLVPAHRIDALRVGSAWERWVPRCAQLVQEILPHLDFEREIQLTRDLGLGDLTIVTRGTDVVGFALWHTTPLAETHGQEELRVLKAVATDCDAFTDLGLALLAEARSADVSRVAFRCQTAFSDAYAALLKLGFRVHWTDLRMTLATHDERRPARGIVFSNWEI